MAMAKFDWDKINIENLDYRHKKTIERQTEKSASQLEKHMAIGHSALHTCPHCDQKVSGSEYKYHFVRNHFPAMGMTVATLLVIKIGDTAVLTLVLPTCVFSDVWEACQSRFDFNQNYSLEDIQHKLSNEIPFIFEARYKPLIGKDRFEILDEIITLLRNIIERLSWANFSLSLKLCLSRFEPDFAQDLMNRANEKRRKPKKSKAKKKGKPKVTKQKLMKRIAKIDQKLEKEELDIGYKNKLLDIRQRLIDKLAASL